MKKGNHNMSYNQTNDPPPPYYGYPNQPPQPSGSSYTYVTTPMMVPMPVYYGQPQQFPQPQNPPALQHLQTQHLPAPQYPQLQHVPTPQQAPSLQQIPVQPTYITNHVYQQPAPPAKPVEDAVEWAPATDKTASEFKQRAFIAANNVLDDSLWIIRARHCGNLVPGKWSTKRCAAFIPYGGKEIPVTSFEILLAEKHMVCWKSSCTDQIPTEAIVAGTTHDGEPLYIGRANFRFIMINGKVQGSKKCCYISHCGTELVRTSYEILCQV